MNPTISFGYLARSSSFDISPDLTNSKSAMISSREKRGPAANSRLSSGFVPRPSSSGGTLWGSPMRRRTEANARERNQQRLLMDHVIKDASGRPYHLFPEKISWRFDSELDRPDDTKHAVVIVGKMDGEAFTIMGMWACRGLVIDEFRGWWSTELCKAGADCVATIWVDENRDDLYSVTASLKKANLPAPDAPPEQEHGQ